MSIEEELARIEALADAATPGPWEAIERHEEDRYVWQIDGDGYWSICQPENSRDVGFIADARTSVPRLLKALRAVLAVDFVHSDEHATVRNAVAEAMEK